MTRVTTPWPTPAQESARRPPCGHRLARRSAVGDGGTGADRRVGVSGAPRGRDGAHRRRRADRAGPRVVSRRRPAGLRPGGGLPVPDRARRARRSGARAGWRVIDVEALCRAAQSVADARGDRARCGRSARRCAALGRRARSTHSTRGCGRRLARPAATVYVAPTDARGAVPAPLPMAGVGVARWQSWLTALGASKVTSATSVLRAAARHQGRRRAQRAPRGRTHEWRSVPGGAARAGAWQMAARDGACGGDRLPRRGRTQRLVLAVDDERAERGVHRLAYVGFLPSPTTTSIVR